MINAPNTAYAEAPLKHKVGPGTPEKLIFSQG